MTDRILKNRDPFLENLTFDQQIPAPKEIALNEVKLRRVARPLRNVRFVPTKELVFRSKNGPMTFSYEKKLKIPVAKNKLIVEVRYVGLNPIDMKIKNGYTNPIYGEAGLGREYSGVITHVGEKLKDTWNEGDPVFGLYYHPHLAVGSLQSAILVDPSVDAIILRPEDLDEKEAAGSLFCLGTAFNILDRLEKKGFLKTESNILINGGASSVGMFAIQLLKRVYKVQTKLVVVTTGTSAEFLKKHFPDLTGDMIFINYLNCRGKSSRPLRKMISEEKAIVQDPTSGTDLEVTYSQGKFDVVLDFIGGYDILKHSQSLIHAGGSYVTTVGDYVADYKNDVFNQWDNPSANMRKMVGSMLYSYDYQHFYFDPNVKSASSNDWLNKCAALLDRQEVTCIIDKVYDWKDLKEAFSYMATQRAHGKVIMKVEKF